MDLYDYYVHKLSKQYLNKQDRVLDCGCGDAAKSNILAQYCDNVIAGDLENRAKYLNGLPFRKIELNNYGNDNEFDVVTSFDVIEHVIDDREYLGEITRVLRPGGIAIIGTPNRKRLSNKLISLVSGPIKYPRTLGYHYESGGAIIHQREYTCGDLINLVGRVPRLKLIELKANFIGVYTPWGALGWKTGEKKLFSEYAQHLFLIVQKTDVED